ncbi:hypothetical protein CROQUDRAFT_91185 [Cronartium quercuum f. sp. fusiforme G11]|uniref:Uncharacterized protein n=1 Tax=Cronartium quercuum f. sp. fusiforme G11 TaxID=708437 RepID=A0A9P6TCS5_9BASI|nr:hypothetical protein CROQUDRAFT_91185 [Cronartium quercuum f. sp. fusiforme G11]
MSNDQADICDPTTLAISLIPLLPPSLTSSHTSEDDVHSTSSLTLPILAASLSTLPGSVINAIHVLGQEVKLMREERVLTGSSFSRDGRLAGVGRSGPSIGNAEESVTREEREKWLETQKINHLKKSISSLTSLHSSLQSRHLNTVDTLSNLQQLHDREKQQLTDERDGVRAVNKVLKRKICNLEKQLDASKDVMEGVLEKVEKVNGGDWSIVDHGRIRVHSPLLANCSPRHGSDHEASGSSWPFAQQHISSTPTNLDLSTTGHSHHHRDPQQEHMQHSTSSGPNNQRSLTLIVELTEEMECLREEAKTELRSKDDEISVLKRLVGFRDDEIKTLMARLEHFMGLNGFYVPIGQTLAEDSANTTDRQATPKARSSKGKGRLNTISDYLDKTPKLGGHHRQLEEEIRRLESELRNLTPDTNSQSGSSVSRASTSRHPRAGLNDGDPTFDEFASLTSLDSCENQALSRALADLSNQVLDLKHALKEVSNERDTLRRLRRKRGDNGRAPTHSTEQGTDDFKSLKKDLEDLRLERNRLNELLMRVESRNFELQNQLVEQEAEFEKVAERVQVKLEEQRAKLYEAKHEIEELQNRLEQAQTSERRGRQELDDEKKRVQVLMGLIGSQKPGRRRDPSPAQSSQTSSSRRNRVERPVPSRPVSRVEGLEQSAAERS